MKTQFHPEAYEEMLASARFYEEKAGGLGADFLAAVEEPTRRIEQFPEAGPVERGTVRKRIVLGFPFTILYENQQAESSLAPSCINTDGRDTGKID